MGRTLWEKLCFAQTHPFAKFEDGLQVPLDLALPTPSVRALNQPLDGPGVLEADAWAPTDWAFPVQRLLESGRARPGLRVVSTDPHVVGLGAYGIVATFRTPAVLHAAWQQRHDRVGLPRRTRVHVNGPPAPGVDAIDAAFHLLREGGVGGYANAVLEFHGDVAAFTPSQQRRLLEATAPTGALTAIAVPQGPDESAVAARADPDAVYDELVVLNADQLQPLVASPHRGLVGPARQLVGRPVERIVVGGCVGGDREALQTLARDLRGGRVPARIELLVVPASEPLYLEIAGDEVGAALAAAGAQLCKPHEIPIGGDAPTLATSSCLAPDALLAGLKVCAATALESSIALPPEAGA